MDHLRASTTPIPFSGEDWFDPLEDAIRFRVRAFIEALVEEDAQAALGGASAINATASARAIATATGSGGLSSPSGR